MYRHLRTKLHTTSRIFSPLPGNRRRIALFVLTKALGHTREKAILFMAEATGKSEDTVRSILRRGL